MLDLEPIKATYRAVGGLDKDTHWTREALKNGRFRIVATDVSTAGETDPPFVVATDVPLLLSNMLCQAKGLPALVDEIERLREEKRAMAVPIKPDCGGAALAGDHGGCACMHARIKALEAELAIARIDRDGWEAAGQACGVERGKFKAERDALAAKMAGLIQLAVDATGVDADLLLPPTVARYMAADLVAQAVDGYAPAPGRYGGVGDWDAVQSALTEYRKTIAE